MTAELKYLLNVNIKKVYYEYDSNKPSFIFSIIAKIILLAIIILSSFIISKIKINSFRELFYLSLVLIDFILKYVLLKIQSVNLNFFKFHLRRKTVVIYILIKSMISYSGIILPALIIGFFELRLVIVFLLISIINSQFVVLIKYFNKYIILLYVSVAYILLNIIRNSNEFGGELLFLILASCTIISSVIFFAAVNISLKNKDEVQKDVRLQYFEIRKGSLFNTLLTHEFLLFLRNKRPRAYLFSGLLASTVAIIALLDGEDFLPYYYYFIMIVITGGYLLSIWQITPFWDSVSFPFFMVNVHSYDYLNNKFMFTYLLSTINLIISFIIIYFFDSSLLLILIAAYAINIGINSKMLLMLNAANSDRIDLDGNPFFNYDGINRFNIGSTLVITFTSLILFELLKLFFTQFLSLILLIGIGVAGLFLHKVFIKEITWRFSDIKYKLLIRYSDKN